MKHFSHLWPKDLHVCNATKSQFMNEEYQLMLAAVVIFAVKKKVQRYEM